MNIPRWFLGTSLVILLAVMLGGAAPVTSGNAAGLAAPIQKTFPAATPTPKPTLTEDINVPPGPGGTPVVLGEIQVVGKVTHGSGGELPADLKVRLEGYENNRVVWSSEGALAADGSFAFDGVRLVANRILIASVDYKGEVFVSKMLRSEDVLPGVAADMPVVIYDSTSDNASLVVERVHIIFDQTRKDTLQVVEWFQIVNPTDKVVVSAGEGKPVVRFRLPEGASNLQFPEGALTGSLVMTDNGFGDLQSILPGSGYQIMFAFDLPASPSQTVTLPFDLAVNDVIVMAPAEGLLLESRQLTPAGERTMQNVRLKVFTAQNLPRGTRLILSLKQESQPDPNLLIALALGGGLFLLAGGGLLLRRRAKPAAASTVMDAGDEVGKLLDMIVSLDERFEAGSVDEDTYRSARNELKERLRKARQGS